MKPTNFPEANRTYTAPRGHEDDVAPLRTWTDGSETVSLWRPSWRERFSLLLHGKLWLHVMGAPPQPVSLSCKRTYFMPGYVQNTLKEARR